MMTRCSAASRVPFGGYAALDTASAPRWIGFYRRLSGEVIGTTCLNGSIPVRLTIPRHLSRHGSPGGISHTASAFGLA
jgi:hypothetical protein